MKVLITGICGFVGSTLARGFLDAQGGDRVEVVGVDNFIRAGSEINRRDLAQRGVKVLHGDLRNPEDVAAFPAADFVIDAAANPSVLAGVDGKSSSKSVFDHNLSSTIHLLEYCKQHKAGFTLLSTSRVYSIPTLAGLPMRVARGAAFDVDAAKALPAGVSEHGVSEQCSTAAPVSLYGVSKLTSEAIALEYGETFKFPVWINRCGVLAGAGQFGRADQGIFAFWINAYLRKRPLKYIGFGGHGHQSRDAMHPLDLLPVLRKQFAHAGPVRTRTCNLGGGSAGAASLRELTDYCRGRFGFDHPVAADGQDRPFDIPWMVMDSRLAAETWGFAPQRRVRDICDEIAAHAEANPNWLAISGA